MSNVIAVALVVLLFVGVLLLGPLVLWQAWNWVVPGVFNGPVITFWHALAICAGLGIVGGFFKTQVAK